MSWASVKKKFGTPRYDKDNTSRGATEVWICQASVGNTYTPADATLAPGVPSYGQSYSGDFWLQVTGKKGRQLTAVLFEVDVDYDFAQDGEDSDEPNPLSQPPDFSYSTAYIQEPIDQDVTGKTIATVNDEPFDPPITIDRADLVVTVTRNIAEFDLAQAAVYADKINADPFLGFAPHTARVVGIGADKVTDYTPNYYRASVSVQIRNTKDPAGNVIGWDKRLLHQGFLVGFSDEPAGEYSHAEDTKGNLVTEPVPLDADGYRKQKGDANVFLKFQVYESIAFAGMDLGV